jgi:hypothetical protein
MASWAGQAIFLSCDHDGALGALEPVEGLLDDLQRLVHLVDADADAVVGVAARAGDDVEVVGLVAAVGLGLAQVVRQAGRAQHRAGDAERHTAGQVEVADTDHAALEQRVLVEQQLELVQALAQLADDLADLSTAPCGRSWATPPGRMYALFIRRPVTARRPEGCAHARGSRRS